MDMQELDVTLLPAPTQRVPQPPLIPPMDITDCTYDIVYNKQLSDSTLEILALLIADKETPPTPKALLLPLNFTSLYQGHMVPPLTPIVHVPTLSLLEPDPPP